MNQSLPLPASWRDALRTVKVRCEYEDGNDWFEIYTEEHAKAGLTFVEIREEEWLAYQNHRVQSRLWGEFIRKKSTEQYEKELPDANRDT